MRTHAHPPSARAPPLTQTRSACIEEALALPTRAQQPTHCVRPAGVTKQHSSGGRFSHAAGADGEAMDFRRNSTAIGGAPRERCARTRALTATALMHLAATS